ncbi:hypothetical protein [Streptomyces tropicalis]|uniref:hypothetical protein n=1 Tax=Streptomyces tropicalis TaxID=3034234 RepID=UPI0028BF462B|nr:hypothetical protein [Streptomyces tropicalis]
MGSLVTRRSCQAANRRSRDSSYAQAGVPFYLLIDNFAPGGPTITLYGEPQGDVYRVLQAGEFGDAIALPEPFGFELDTGEFPVD